MRERRTSRTRLSVVSGSVTVFSRLRGSRSVCGIGSGSAVPPAMYPTVTTTGAGMASRSRNLAPWRAECLARRGSRCRNCGDPNVEMDHIIPRSQGGRDDVENGLPLCSPWGRKSPFPNGCHAAKTDRRLKLTIGMLDQDQIEYLRKEGWCEFDDAGRPTGGRGFRGFEG